MSEGIIIAIIGGCVSFALAIYNNRSNNKKMKELEARQRDDKQAEAIQLCLKSCWFVLHGLQQLRNEETGEPLINGESHELQKRIEKFEEEMLKKSL